MRNLIDSAELLRDLIAATNAFDVMTGSSLTVEQRKVRIDESEYLGTEFPCIVYRHGAGVFANRANQSQSANFELSGGVGYAVHDLAVGDMNDAAARRTDRLRFSRAVGDLVEEIPTHFDAFGLLGLQLSWPDTPIRLGTVNSAEIDGLDGDGDDLPAQSLVWEFVFSIQMGIRA